MREFALNRAQSVESIGGSLVTLYGNWRARCQTAKLATCDDQLLRKLAITRDEVQWALRLPLSQNSRLALEERAFMRTRL